MSGRGRPERPINADGGPLSEFAGELRRLRRDRTYRDLAAETGLSVTTLRAAAAGDHLPKWRVVRAFVLACDGEGAMGAIRELWVKACIAAGRPVPDDSLPSVPDPEIISNGAQFVEEMKRLRVWAGNPSLAELNRRSGGFLLPPSTISEALRKPKLPQLSLVQAYLRACGLDDSQAAAWEQTWAMVTAREMQKQLPKTATLELQGNGSRAAGLRDALRWLSGVPAAAWPAPANSPDGTALGGIVLLTSVMIMLAAAWGVHVVLTPSWPAAVVDGMTVGVAITSLYRLVMASIHRGQGRKESSRRRASFGSFTAPRAPHSNPDRPTYIRRK